MGNGEVAYCVFLGVCYADAFRLAGVDSTRFGPSPTTHLFTHVDFSNQFFEKRIQKDSHFFFFCCPHRAASNFSPQISTTTTTTLFVLSGYLLFKNNSELYLHDHTNTYSIAKAMFRNQNYNTAGQLRYFVTLLRLDVCQTFPGLAAQHPIRSEVKWMTL